MNLLLLHPTEIRNGHVTLVGRRAKHCLTVLKTEVGATLRAGIENQGTCNATVERVGDESVDLSIGNVTPATPPKLHVALAVPRPKGLSRVVAAASSFGLKSLTLFNAWRVERSYFSSPRLAPERVRDDLLLGAEQGQQVWVPDFRLVTSFRQFAEETTERWGSTTRLVFDPGAGNSVADLLLKSPRSVDAETLICFGPDGGFIEAELKSFREAQFKEANLMTGPLRTEVAVAAALGQMALVFAEGKAPPL